MVQAGLIRWLVAAWAAAVVLVLLGALLWFALQLAVLALVVAVPLVALAAIGTAFSGWFKRRQARRRGHELVEVTRAQYIAD